MTARPMPEGLKPPNSNSGILGWGKTFKTKNHFRGWQMIPEGPEQSAWEYGTWAGIGGNAIYAADLGSEVWLLNHPNDDAGTEDIPCFECPDGRLRVHLKDYHTTDGKGYLLVVSEVPHHVCDKCGDECFGHAANVKIEKAREASGVVYRNQKTTPAPDSAGEGNEIVADAYYIPEKDEDGEFNSGLLIGPDGFYCQLGEPEDRTWYRDGNEAVVRLNSLHSALTASENRVRVLEEALDFVLKSATPHPEENPRMWMAWKIAKAALAQPKRGEGEKS